jgi:hypothetical protein
LFDGSQDEKGMLLYVDPKTEITKEFVTFCNARFAGPAKPATPK